MLINAKNLGIAGGLLWGISMFLFTLFNHYTGYGSMWAALMVDIYPGYDISIMGSFIALIYGFIDGFVGLFLLAWIYNALSRTMESKS